MNRFSIVSCGIALAFAGQAALACDYPERVSVPNGASATHYVFPDHDGRLVVSTWDAEGAVFVLQGAWIGVVGTLLGTLLGLLLCWVLDTFEIILINDTDEEQTGELELRLERPPADLVLRGVRRQRRARENGRRARRRRDSDEQHDRRIERCDAVPEDRRWLES